MSYITVIVAQCVIGAFERWPWVPNAWQLPQTSSSKELCLVLAGARGDPGQAYFHYTLSSKRSENISAHRSEDVNGNKLAATTISISSTVGTITCIQYNGAACCSHRHSPAVIKAECKSGCCVIPCENCPFLAARLLPYYKSAQRPHPSSPPLRPSDRVLRRIVHLRHVLLDIERVCIHTAGRRFASVRSHVRAATHRCPAECLVIEALARHRNC